MIYKTSFVRSFVFGALASSLVGCTFLSSSSSKSGIQALEQGAPDAACPKTHVKMYFSMVPTTATQKIPERILSNDPERKTLRLLSPDANSNILIETCMDGDGNISKMLGGSIYRKNLPDEFVDGRIDQMFSGSKWNSESGFTDAAFGDMSKLNAKLVLEDFEGDPRFQLVLNGWTLENKTFMTARMASINDDKQNKFDDVLVGELVPDLPKQENGCSAFEEFREKTTELNLGTVKTKMCAVIKSHLDATIYRALELEVDLPAEGGNPAVQLKVDEKSMLNNKDVFFDGTTVHGGAFGFRIKKGDTQVFVLAMDFLVFTFDASQFQPKGFPEEHLSALEEMDSSERRSSLGFSVKRGTKEWTPFELKTLSE